MGPIVIVLFVTKRRLTITHLPNFNSHFRICCCFTVGPEIQVRETDFVINNAQNIVLPCSANGRPRPKVCVALK